MAELRIGLVGTGGIGRTHIERINNQLQGGKVVAFGPCGWRDCSAGWTAPMRPQGDIFRDADTALYRVKEAGRNGCEVFNGSE